VVIEPGQSVSEHDHDEEETFIVIDGAAELTLDRESTTITAGDVAYIPRFGRHGLRNLSSTSPFVMIDIYWDWGGGGAPSAGTEAACVGR
jgi:quercetin dioxygenase-like cupin family protein